MSDTIIKIENVSKEYRLGAIGGGTLRSDLQSLMAKIRGNEDPNSQIGQGKISGNERFFALDNVSFSVKKLTFYCFLPKTLPLLFRFRQKNRLFGCQSPILVLSFICEIMRCPTLFYKYRKREAPLWILRSSASPVVPARAKLP